MPSRYLRFADDVALAYRHAGPTTLPDVTPRVDRGSCVVLLHGAGGSSGLWTGLLESLAQAQHSPIALDLPGHGRSSGLDGPSSVTEAAGFVLRLLEALAAPRVILVGHGMGGQVALRLAIDRPARVRAVVALGASAAPAADATSCVALEREIAILDQVIAGRLPQQFDMPVFGVAPAMDVMRGFWGEMVRTDPRVRCQDLRCSLATDLRPEIGRIECPVLSIRGSADRLCSSAESLALVNGVPRSRAIELEGAGHVAFLEQQEALLEAMREVLG